MPKAAGSTNAEQREATMTRLIEVACDIFTQQGYANTAAEDIVKQAGVTRGALYHHFGSKEGLFQAVLAHVQQKVGERIESVFTGDKSAWEELIAGCDAFLEASLDPQVQRIMLIDAPAVLGWALWRQMDAQNSMKLLREALSDLMTQNELPHMPLEALTHLLSGAMNEAALWIAQAQDAQTALSEAKVALGGLLNALKTSGA